MVFCSLDVSLRYVTVQGELTDVMTDFTADCVRHILQIVEDILCASAQIRSVMSRTCDHTSVDPFVDDFGNGGHIVVRSHWVKGKLPDYRKIDCFCFGLIDSWIVKFQCVVTVRISGSAF